MAEERQPRRVQLRKKRHPTILKGKREKEQSEVFLHPGGMKFSRTYRATPLKKEDKPWKKGGGDSFEKAISGGNGWGWTVASHTL